MNLTYGIGRMLVLHFHWLFKDQMVQRQGLDDKLYDLGSAMSFHCQGGRPQGSI